jgi:hypothetical protein
LVFGFGFGFVFVFCFCFSLWLWLWVLFYFAYGTITQRRLNLIFIYMPPQCPRKAQSCLPAASEKQDFHAYMARGAVFIIDHHVRLYSLRQPSTRRKRSHGQ